MRLREILLPLVALLFLGIAARGDEAAVKKEIRAAYDKHAQAFKAKDAKAWMAITTPDFTVKALNGATATRAQAESSFTMQTSHLKSIRECSIAIEQLTIKGDKASAVTLTQFSGAVSDASNKSHDLVQKEKTQDTWVKGSAGWRIKHSEMLTFEVTVDGKTMHPYGNKPAPPAPKPSK